MHGYGRDYRYARDYGPRGQPRGGANGEWRFGNWGDRSGLRGGERHRYDGFLGGNRPERGTGEGLANVLPQGGPGYDRGYRPRDPHGARRFTGMESNRYRGVYGSDYRLGGPNRGQHGGYRGDGWDRGGGMNPGRAPRGR